MKKRKMILCLCFSVLLFGCGDREGEEIAEQEVINMEESGNNESVEDKDASVVNDTEVKEEGDTGKEDTDSKTDEKSFSDMEEALEGMVQKVEENSVVISRIFSGESEEDGLYYAFSPGEGSEEEELITVYVTDDTRYQYQTIKNGGEDVTETEGSFTDIKKDLMVKVTGNMNETKDEMQAKEIVIIEVV